MLSSLPPELLRQIIESTVPSAYHSETYRSRQTTLCTLSLVSHRFRQIAQPLLRRVVHLLELRYNSGSAECILSAASLKGWEEAVRQLVMHTEADTDKSGFAIDQIVAAYPRLAELVIASSRPLRQNELNAISKLSELRSLHIGYCNLDPIHLPGLETLTLSEAYGQKGGLKAFLQPSMLPALQALALFHIPQDDLLDLLCDPSSLLLLRQVDALFVHASIFYNSDAILRKMQPFLSKALVHLNKNETSTRRRTLSTLPHLRLDFRPSCRSLVKDIERDQSGLKSLYLAIPRQAPHFGGLQREQDRINLLAVCSAHKVEVIEEEQPSAWRYDPFISPEFWRRQRELKRLAGVQ
ncbi:hypothetical protein JCM5353_007314 [Sporobolomyces roseus]